MDSETSHAAITLAVTVTILIIDIVIRLWLIFYIPRNRKPSAALAWLLTIALAPLLGTFLYLILGSTRLSRYRRQRQKDVVRRITEANGRLKKEGAHHDVPKSWQRHGKLAASLGGFSSTTGNTVSIINGYDELIDDITNAVSKAESYVYVEFFILSLDAATQQFFIELINARHRGVEVYVLYDWFGSRKYKNFRKMKRLMIENNIHHKAMLPIRLHPRHYSRPDLRNHRKIVAIDNHTAYTGSLNMINATYDRKDAIHYTELVAKMIGPVAYESATVAATDWLLETGTYPTIHQKTSIPAGAGTTLTQMLPSGPGYAYQNNLKYLVAAIHASEESVELTNPYFVPDETLLAAIVAAAQRGVKVSLLNSEAMDQWMVGHAQRSYYEELLRAGVEIYLYPAPELIHSKYMVFDKQTAIIGSSNLDIRSFELNYECMTIAYDQRTAKTLSRYHQQDLKRSQRLTLQQWKKRPARKAFLDSLARLTSDLQ